MPLGVAQHDRGAGKAARHKADHRAGDACTGTAPPPPNAPPPFVPPIAQGTQCLMSGVQRAKWTTKNASLKITSGKKSQRGVRGEGWCDKGEGSGCHWLALATFDCFCSLLAVFLPIVGHFLTTLGKSLHTL